MAEDLATIPTIESAWRPLTAVETTRAEYYLGVASRRIRRRWPDVDTRIASGDLDADAVSDVVVQLVLGTIEAAPVRNAKSWSETAGAVSKSVTLAGGRTELLAFEDWMIAVFEGGQSPRPVFCMPPAGSFEAIWPEEKP